jgi:hypothetical protein
MNNPIILEKGHNTSGIYAFLTSMFYMRSDSVNKLLNMDDEDIGISYVQEFLKEEIIGRLQLNRSMPINTVDRFRNLLFNFGWRRDRRHNLDGMLEESDPADIYRFLFIEGMRNRLSFERVEQKENKVDSVAYDAIEIGPQDLVFSDGDRPVINLSSSIKRWIQKNIVESDSHDYSYRFKELPYLIPVFIDPNINNTVEKDRVPIDIKEAIGFQSLNDPVQKIFIWDIQSVILHDTIKNEYISIVRDDEGAWYRLSDSKYPANEPIDMADPKVVSQIARQVRAVFYKIK